MELRRSDCHTIKYQDGPEEAWSYPSALRHDAGASIGRLSQHFHGERRPGAEGPMIRVLVHGARPFDAEDPTCAAIMVCVAAQVGFAGPTATYLFQRERPRAHVRNARDPANQSGAATREPRATAEAGVAYTSETARTAPHGLEPARLTGEACRPLTAGMVGSGASTWNHR